MDRKKEETLSAPGRPPIPPAATTESAQEALFTASQITIVDFRSGEAVVRHPQLKKFLQDGWQIKSAVPHVAETEEVRLLVEMIRAAEAGRAVASD